MKPIKKETSTVDKLPSNSYTESNLELNREQLNARLNEEIDINNPTNTNYGSIKSNSEFLLSNSPRGDYNPLNDQMEREISSAVKKHLVTFSDIRNNSDNESYSNSLLNQNEDVTSLHSNADNFNNEEPILDSHLLQSGDITRDIYKWQQEVDRKTRMKRSNSMPYLRDAIDEDGNLIATPSSLLIPGAFRRHHILTQNERDGRDTNLITTNFLDFLALYGHFAGEIYPLDDNEETILDELEEEEIGQQTNERARLIRRMSNIEMNPPPATGSAGKAVFLLIKSFVGTGVLFLPRSFYDGGMAFSFLFLILISLLGLHTMLLLIEAQLKIGGSFGDMGEILFGKWTRKIILFSIVISQIGFSCTYIIFIAKNLEQVFYNVTQCQYIIPEYSFILIQLLIYIPIAMLRKIKSLSLMALIADVFIVIGLFYLVYFNVNYINQNGLAEIQYFNSANFTTFIGTAIFTFEGIGLIIPILQSMKEPEKFPKILSYTMLFITIVFVFIGALSYLTFGDQVKTVVLLNLPKDHINTSLIQSMYAVAIILSVPLQVFPIIAIIEQLLFSKSGKRSMIVKWNKNIIRILIVLLISYISYVGSSSLNHFVSLIGSFCCIPLSFIFPALFHLKILNDENNHSFKTSLIKMKNILIIVVGFVMMFYVTYQTLMDWNNNQNDNAPICK
ncbi:hypothetical protein K502DRAFT_323966 [Neoconidiobolus thromboides FSU 785]|nr:hypothetical protein K502DRAFT_323966 [Neoconidiobolus thromboides FSU 785]